jgi:hypothetical protein
VVGDDARVEGEQSLLLHALACRLKWASLTVAGAAAACVPSRAGVAARASSSE